MSNAVFDKTLKERIIAAEDRIDVEVLSEYKSFVSMKEKFVDIPELCHRYDSVMNAVLAELIRNRDAFALGYVADLMSGAKFVYANRVRNE